MSLVATKQKRKRKRNRLTKSYSTKGKPVNGSGLPTTDDQLAKVSVPISFGTSLDDVLGAINYERQTMTIKQFVEDYADSIDVNPPYQRDDAWSQKQQAAFIQSAFNKGMAIPPFFLCKKNKRPDCAKWWALDCRQRTTALLDFFDSKFKITVYLYWGSGSVTSKRLSWKEISSSPEYDGIRVAFTSRTIDLNIFDWLPLSDQRIIFEALNNGTPLNMDEVTYCKWFLTRKVLADLYSHVLGGISKHFVSSVRGQRRFAHIRTMHEILILIGGQDWESKTVEPRALRKQERLTSAKDIHSKLEGIKFDYEEDVTAEIRRSLGLQGRLAPLTNIANLLSEIFEEQATLGREKSNGNGKISTYLNARQVIDPLGFLFGKVQVGETTVNDLSQNKEGLIKFLRMFYTKKPELGLNQSTSDIKVMTEKFKLMNTLFKRFLA